MENEMKIYEYNDSWDSLSEGQLKAREAYQSGELTFNGLPQRIHVSKEEADRMRVNSMKRIMDFLNKDNR